MINILFIIPAFIVGYAACYFIMTYKVDQWKNPRLWLWTGKVLDILLFGKKVELYGKKRIVKKINNTNSQHKLKRAIKNKKRLFNKVQLSAFEIQQARLRKIIIGESLNRMAVQKGEQQKWLQNYMKK